MTLDDLTSIKMSGNVKATSRGLLRWPNKITELDDVRWPNYIAETCVMTKFARTVNLNWLSLTKIKVHSPLDVSINFGQTQTIKVYSPLVR